MQRFIAILLATLAILVAGCGTATPAAPAAPAATATPAPISITDDAGRSHTFAAPPARIVSIAPSNTEILFAVGAGERVVAVDRFSDYPAEAKTKENVGSYIKPDLEKLIAAAPDVVFATRVHLKEVIPQLEARGIPAVVLEPKDLDQVLDRIGLVGKITGREDAARTLVAGLRARIARVSEKIAGAPRPRVFFEIDPKLFTAGPGTFIDDLIGRAGGTNIAADATTAYPKLGSEIVVLKDPEVIVLADEVAGETAEKVKARSGWQSIAAVRSGRIVAIDPNITNRPGPRLVEGLEALARALHPERFR